MDPTDTSLAADEAGLHAFVDGCIGGGRRQAMLEPIAVDRAAKARAETFGRQNALLAALRQSLKIGHAPLPLARLEEELRHLVADKAARPAIRGQSITCVSAIRRPSRRPHCRKKRRLLSGICRRAARQGARSRA